MFIDANLQLANAQAITATAVSTNVIDLGNVSPNRQVGDGEPLTVVVAINVAADFTTGDETYELEVIQSATANMGSPTVIARQPFVATLLVAGFMASIPIPPGFPTQEFIALNVVTGGTTPSVTLTAWLTPRSLDGVKPQVYKKGFTIS